MGHHHGHHDHGHQGHAHGAPAGARDRTRERRALAVVLALTLSFAAVEVAGGLVAGSVALLADAAHMLSDAASLALALGALWLAGRPATTRLSFGWRRAEILAALANGALLAAVGGWVVVEAAMRLADPPAVRGGVALVVGAVGLLVNVVGAAILMRSGGGGLNVRAALAHVLADLAGSVGVVVAGAVILTTGWRPIDPLLGLAIGALVLWGAWRVLREAVAVLLEATPAGVDGDAVGRAMAAVEGVREVHDLHIWTITSGFPALAAHVTVEPGTDCRDRRRALAVLLAREFGIAHTTLQVEPAAPERRIHQVSTT